MEGSESKRVCRISSLNSDVGVDRLGALPDVALIEILNFLGIHESPRTHGLLKRWRFLWVFCPEMHFVVHGPDAVSQILLTMWYVSTRVDTQNSSWSGCGVRTWC